MRDSDLIPRSGRSPGEGNGNPLQHSCLENPMDRGAWQATVHGVAESDITEWLTLHFKADIYVCVCVCVRLSLKFLRWLYSFTMSAITKYHKLGRWKQQKCIVSEFGNLELLKSGSVISTCYHRQTPSKGSGEESLLASSGFWWLLAVLGTPHLMSAWVQSLVLTWPSSLYISSVSVILFPTSYKNTSY